MNLQPTTNTEVCTYAQICCVQTKKILREY